MYKVSADTCRGKVCSTNQDSFAWRILSDQLAYLIVCDGMGGESGGNVASYLAVNMVKAALDRSLVEGIASKSVRAALQSAVSAANAKILAEAQRDPRLKGMGTTLVAAVIVGSRAHFASVGDSRIYLGSREGLKQLTHDHTVVQMLLENGEITPEEAKDHPKRHYITRAVGVAPQVEMDYDEAELEPGDSLLLCSDGLYNMLSEEELRELTAQKNLGRLMRQANENGGADNITGVLLSLE